MQPKTRYAKSGDGSIAYQVLGEGPLDLVFIPGFVSNVEFYWELPTTTRAFERLASFSRVVLWDKRGTGLSDPIDHVPTLDERTDDVMALMLDVQRVVSERMGVKLGAEVRLIGFDDRLATALGGGGMT